MVGIKKTANMMNPLRPDPVLEIIHRSRWQARDPASKPEKLLLPCNDIRFTHTASDSCSTLEECRKVLRQVQNEQMDLWKQSDISFNFMISAAGDIYEGRGWEAQSSMPGLQGDLQFVALNVAYIGRYNDEDEPGPTPIMVRAATELILYAMYHNKMTHYFKAEHLV